MMSGSAIDMQYAAEHVNAILQVWYPGARGGKAAADILFGACSPSGKLPVTFYKDLDGFPSFEDYSMKGRTYRYLEKEPLYPFGYGLTYGKVIVKTAGLAGKVTEGEALTVKAVLENTGAYDTDEVVQVYIKDLDSRYAVPNHSLCAFKRVSLKKGETAEIELKVPYEALMAVDEEGKKYVDGSHFVLSVGTSQPDDRSISLTGTEPAKLEISLA